MSDAALIFKTEMYYGDELQISIRPAEFNRVGFDLFYKVEKKAGGKWITAASAKTAMVCYNYELKKIVALPESVRIKLSR
jgi:acyl-CoA thioesterase FadM